MDITSFANIARDMASRGCATDTMIKLDGETLKAGERLGGLGARLLRNAGGNNQGLAVRNELLNALRGEFAGKIPASVLKAMKVDDAASGFSIENVDGKANVVAADRPLTLRRVQAILDAVTVERVMRTAQTQIASACEQIKQKIDQQPELSADKQSNLTVRLQLQVHEFAKKALDQIRDFAKTPMTDFCAIRDKVNATFDLFFDRVDNGIAEIEKKQAERKVVTAFAHKVINEAIGKIARERFATAGIKDVIGAKVTFNGDEKIAARMEKFLKDESEEAFVDEAACDKFITSQIVKIVGDGYRGQSVTINGEVVPAYDATHQDPDRTQTACEKKLRQMLEKAFLDPSTGKVDKQALALAIKTMTQRLMYLAPVVQPGIDAEGVLPVDVLATGRRLQGTMTTNLVTLVPGKWQVDVEYSAYNDSFMTSTEPDRVYNTELLEGSKPGVNVYGFKTQLTFTSGVIGNEGEPALPTVECNSEKTSVFFNVAKLETREHAKTVYREFLREVANGGGNKEEMAALLKGFNDRLARINQPKMDDAQFRQWVAKNEKALTTVFLTNSDEDLAEAKEEEQRSLQTGNVGGMRGYPARGIYGCIAVASSMFFEVYQKARA